MSPVRLYSSDYSSVFFCHFTKSIHGLFVNHSWALYTTYMQLYVLFVHNQMLLDLINS